MADSKDAPNTSMAKLLRSNLPPEILGVLHQTSEVADALGQKLFLVGGVVRDLLLGRKSFDLDLVVEGEAIKLSEALAKRYPGHWTVHHRFGTAKLRQDNWSLDLASARRESYTRPGALPAVRPGSIREDLFRRDFTINAMAVHLDPTNYGKLLDPFKGTQDLSANIIRILHQKSFVDDATRMFRAIRYEQRLGFKLDESTETRLRQDLAFLDTISGDRIRHELELIFKEDQPELVLCRADELGLLAALQPGIKGDSWLAEKFVQARQHSRSDRQLASVYMCLLVYNLTDSGKESFIKRIHPTTVLAHLLRDTLKLKSQQKALNIKALTPSRIYRFLEEYHHDAILANALATSLPKVKERLELYLDKLRHTKARLNGDDLLALGVSPGPQMGQILQALQDARLEGKVDNEPQERAFVEECLKREAVGK